MKNGRRYHHILDPTLGEPARGCRSVTIVADRAVWPTDSLQVSFCSDRTPEWRSSSACPTSKA